MFHILNKPIVLSMISYLSDETGSCFASNKYKASIVICEYGKPSEERFTKLIKIIFDKKNEYKISSYRNEEIREKDFEKRIKISKESTY